MGSQIIEVPGHGPIEFPDSMSDTDIGSAIQKITGPSSGGLSAMKERVANYGNTRPQNVIANAAREVPSDIIDMFGNAPANLGNLGSAAYHFLSKSNEAWKPPFNPPNLATRASRAIGFTSDEYAPTSKGEQLAAAISKGLTGGISAGAKGALIGGVGAGAGDIVAEQTNSPALGVATNLLAGKGANKAIDTANTAVAKADLLRKQNQGRIDTHQELRDAGYVVPPAYSNPNAKNTAMETIAGTTESQKQASILNERNSARLVRKELGLNEDVPLNGETIDKLLYATAQPYREVANLPKLPLKQTGTAYLGDKTIRMYSKATPSPEQLLHDWKDANDNARNLWKDYQRNAQVETLDKYRAEIKRADGLSSAMEDVANAANRPELVQQLRDARVKLAKIHAVDQSLNADRGEISTIDLARAKDRGVKLTGELDTIAKMGSTYPLAVRDPKRIDKAGNLRGDVIAGSMAGGVGYGLGQLAGLGPMGSMAIGAAASTVPEITRHVARSRILSDKYQNANTTPTYQAGPIDSFMSGSKLRGNPVRAYLLAKQLQGQSQ